ncbi:MAG: ATP-binding cassette domain-containing protein, partial [Deltaproteobacteria bacterium]|nr:ATP-binding cassette domain-containing protein [Deltaproteobacteria bacterium]
KRNSYRYIALYHAGMDTIITMIVIAVILAGAYFIMHDSMQIGDLLTFLLYIDSFIEPVRKLVQFTEQFQNGYSGYERFLEMMAIEPDIQDAPNALALPSVRGEIVFDKVSFHYRERAGDILSQVNLKVDAGEYVALAGSSGAGKTTLCSLIPRFYEVSSGTIRIDGHDIRDLQLASLRSHIGIVQQDVYLFAGTVLENIRYGRPDAPDSAVINAAKAANAHDFIMDLPQGYDTDIGQRGIKLSGGQKQRLAIARVFLKDPPILIFDEATSALDNESERTVRESLRRLAQGRTTLVIAHRLSTIRHAHRILVLTEHGITEEGSHDELMARRGAYWQLYQAQFET